MAKCRRRRTVKNAARSMFPQMYLFTKGYQCLVKSRFLSKRRLEPIRIDKVVAPLTRRDSFDKATTESK